MQLGLASNPWQILASAAIFLNVVSGLGVFIAPMTGLVKDLVTRGLPLTWQYHAL
jgi:cytosine/uracil/thiamine/allantoin permease